ncbi:hypothetical protein MTP99_013486 [Tenebrio molitor]|nr:hypothetical protein MTP99_013486 [Tenebrio molitor]
MRETEAGGACAPTVFCYCRVGQLDCLACCGVRASSSHLTGFPRFGLIWGGSGIGRLLRPRPDVGADRSLNQNFGASPRRVASPWRRRRLVRLRSPGFGERAPEKIRRPWTDFQSD